MVNNDFERLVKEVVEEVDKARLELDRITRNLREREEQDEKDYESFLELIIKEYGIDPSSGASPKSTDTSPSTQPPNASASNQPSYRNTPTERAKRATILSPLDRVFIDDYLKDQIVTRVSIPNLLEGTEPAYSGVILYGPPGTGKTVLLRAIADVYKLAGASGQEISVTNINSYWVGLFAKNLERAIRDALEESRKRSKPSFLFFDEASILAEKPAEGAEGVTKHYQEVMDVMKRYVGNERNLVIGISTNLLSESFDEALTREGRLTPYFIGHPNTEQRRRMWKHFAKEYEIMSLLDEQAQRLAEAIPAEQGAFIEEFCRNYSDFRKMVLVRQNGYPTYVAALKDGVHIPTKEIKGSFNFDNLYRDLIAHLKAKCDRLDTRKPNDGKSTAGYLYL